MPRCQDASCRQRTERIRRDIRIAEPCDQYRALGDEAAQFRGKLSYLPAELRRGMVQMRGFQRQIASLCPADCGAVFVGVDLDFRNAEDIAAVPHEDPVLCGKSGSAFER